MSLDVRFWGTRGSRPTPTTRQRITHGFGGNTSCVGVTLPDGAVVVLDSGTGIAELGQLLASRGPVEVLLLITHTHWDHVQGLPFFEPADIAGNTVEIRGPSHSGASLSAALDTQMSPVFFPVTMDRLRANVGVSEIADCEPFTWHDVKITPHRLPHTTPTLGYRLDADASLVYATDCELRPLIDARREHSDFSDLADWAADADLLIHDSQYSAEEYLTRRGWGHSTPGDAVLLAEAAAARSLALWHHDPAHSDADIVALVDEARAAATVSVFAACEGDALGLATGVPVMLG